MGEGGVKMKKPQDGEINRFRTLVEYFRKRGAFASGNCSEIPNGLTGGFAGS